MFSIIVPVYNRQKFLQKCIDSLVNQTFRDIEIILVNDCSTDGSLDIIKENIKRDSRIKLVNHEENKSTIQSRRSGFLASTYDYILFVDGDDYIDINTCENIYKILSSNKYDIIFFNRKHAFYRKNKQLSDKVYNFDTFFKSREYFNDNVFEELIVNHKECFWSVCTKCLNRALVEKSFDYIGDARLTWLEDFVQTLVMSYYARSLKIIDDTYYYSVRHGNNAYSDKSVDKYFNAYLPNYTRIQYLIMSFIKENNINEKYPVINSYQLLIESFNNLTKSTFNNLRKEISLLPIMFGIFHSNKKLILYIFFIKIVFNKKDINKLAWWIPVKKWRQKFRAKFQ